MRRLFALAAFVACTPAATPEVMLLGATAIEHGDGGRIYWFDAPARPRLRVPPALAERLEITWSNGQVAEIASVKRRGDGLMMIELARPSRGGGSLVGLCPAREAGTVPPGRTGT